MSEKNSSRGVEEVWARGTLAFTKPKPAERLEIVHDGDGQFSADWSSDEVYS